MACIFVIQCAATGTSRLRGLHIQDVSTNTTSCTSLGNHGTYFSVELQVGTPAQKFDVVADTGSDDVIIPSCLCVDAGTCSESDRCFVGTNKSSTFVSAQSPGEVPVVSMEFGSGTIAAAVTTDTVRIGDVSAIMQDSLLLMVERELDIRGPFEGILGLGRPRPPSDQDEYDKDFSGDNGSDPQLEEAVFVIGSMRRPGQSHKRNSSSHRQRGHGKQEPALADAREIPGFLEMADVSRFSICFNDGILPGVLRLNTPQDPNAMGAVGRDHWGLDFRGFSIGYSSGEGEARALFCNDDRSMLPGQESPCAMIPDSGTTVIMGPDEQIKTLFGSICEQWERCSKSAKENPSRPKHEVFQTELLGCESWLRDSEGGLDELPSLNMHLRGREGKKQMATLTPWAYVFESEIEDANSNLQLLSNIAPSQTLRDIVGDSSAVCMPAFGATDYVTSMNGAVWIVGTPLFYEYVVTYDRESTPPSISLSEAQCGQCDGQTSLVLGEGNIYRTTRSGHSPRRIRGPPRVKRLRHDKPL